MSSVLHVPDQVQITYELIVSDTQINVLEAVLCVQARGHGGTGVGSRSSTVRLPTTCMMIFDQGFGGSLRSRARGALIDGRRGGHSIMLPVNFFGRRGSTRTDAEVALHLTHADTISFILFFLFRFSIPASSSDGMLSSSRSGKTWTVRRHKHSELVFLFLFYFSFFIFSHPDSSGSRWRAVAI